MKRGWVVPAPPPAFANDIKEIHRMSKQKVLFVCIHNSARSQMAEELLRKIAGDRFEAESAGIEPGQLNPLVVEVLKEEKIDISGKATQSVLDLHKSGKRYDYVVTVCDEGNARQCPAFPGGKKIHWSFADPSQLEGSHDEKIKKVREIKDQIKTRIEAFIPAVAFQHR